MSEDYTYEGLQVDIKGYMAKQRETFKKQSEHVRDYSVFDFNYMPEEPHFRDEAKDIISSLIRYEKTGIPTNQVIFGSRGSGKTLTIKYLTKILEQESSLRVIYANVRYYSTSFKILAHFLKTSSRGNSMSELYERFRAKYPSKTIIILDEVHLWAPKEKQRELLYLLSRDAANYLVIMLSNDPRFLSEIDQSVKSTLQPELIHFQNYDAVEMTSILQARANLGLSKCEPKVCHEISAITVKEANSDVRVGLKALYYWATHEIKETSHCFENARKDIYADLVNNLSDTNLLILRAVSAVEDKFAKKVYRAYREISERVGMTSCSYVHFYNQLSYLQSLGLILLLSTKVNRTYANRISLLFNQEIVAGFFRARF